MDERIDAYLRGHENEIHADILRLVAIPSVSENRGQARRALKEFLAMAASMGFTVREAAGGDVGIATVGPDESAGAEPPRPFETMGILAHVDVVDPGTRRRGAVRPGGKSPTARCGTGNLGRQRALVICLWAVKALRDLGILFANAFLIVGTRRRSIGGYARVS